MREVVRAVSAVGLAYAAMAAVASAGLWLAGVRSVGGATAAAVAMAGGGAATMTAALPTPGAGGVELHGAVAVTPLGVSLAGALVLVMLLCRPAPSVRARAVRLATVAVTMPAALALAALAGHGRLRVTPPCADRHDAYGLVYCGGPLRGGLTLTYHTELGRTLLGGLGWTLVVLALVVLLDAPTWVRPAVRAFVAVTGCAVLAVTLAGLAAAVVYGRRVAGAALLLAPDATFAGVSRGVGVPWSLGRAGTGSAPPLLLPAVFATVILLVAGALTAVRTPVPRGAAWWPAVRLASVTGPLIAAMTAAAGASAHLDLAVFGVTFPALGVRASGDILVALVFGTAAGAVAGLVGGLLPGWIGRVLARRGRVWTGWNGRRAPR